jgi:hypothetical protein
MRADRWPTVSRQQEEKVVSKDDDDALCAAQARHMEHPLRTDRITLVVKHRCKELKFWRSRLAEAFDRCEAVHLAKGEDEDDVLTAAYLAGVEAGKKIAKRDATAP